MISNHYDGSIEAYNFFYSCRYTPANKFDWANETSKKYYSAEDFMPLSVFLDLPRKPIIIDPVVNTQAADELLEEAYELKRQKGVVSTRLLRNTFNIGYPRAFKIKSIINK